MYVYATWGRSWTAAGEWSEPGVCEHPERGYVVREITPAVPYGRMTPVRTFKRRHAADKLADKLTFGGT